MEGIPAGQGRVLTVEREFEASRLEWKLWATAYEEVLPPLRRERRIARRGDAAEAVDGLRRRAR